MAKQKPPQLTLEQKEIFEKIYRDLYGVITKAGFEMVEHGEKSLFASSHYKGNKIEVKISIK